MSTLIAARRDSILSKLTFLYGEERASEIYEQIAALLGRHVGPPPLRPTEKFSEKSVVLIAYGDQVLKASQPTLISLGEFLHEFCRDIIDTVHILPFFPYSSDDGFAIIDYLQVNPKLGGWQEIENLASQFRLMFDAVINHTSAECPWFTKYLAGDPEFRDFYLSLPWTDALLNTVRPRTTPLLTDFVTPDAVSLPVWTTFSPDQVDLNYQNPSVLLRIISVLLDYLDHGAKLIRLDAIGYLWKRPGTSCIHLPETHAMVQLLRELFEIVDPQSVIITETNVPHPDNVSYFGDGHNEAHMVYQFTLPPLLLFSYLMNSAKELTAWAKTLVLPSKNVTFFNFLASHDGIGMTPLQGILKEDEINALVQRVCAHGGLVSYKATQGNASTIPYELNCTYLNAISSPDEPEDQSVAKFLGAHSIMLSLQGVPGLYFHSLVGSTNDYLGVKRSGHKRSINRERLSLDTLRRELTLQNSRRNKIFGALAKMLTIRRALPVFSPSTDQNILDIHPAIFAIRRSRPGYAPLCAIHNLTNAPIDLNIDSRLLDMGTNSTLDLLSGRRFLSHSAKLKVKLTPYEFIWLSAY